MLDGISSIWDKKGNQKFEGSFKNGIQEGLTKEWYTDGKLESECNYKNDEKDGLCKKWYSNGNQKFECNFKNGKKEGLHIYWNENGDWTSIKNYDLKGLEKFLKKEDLSQEIRDMLPTKVTRIRTNYDREVLYKNTSILFSGVYQEYYTNGKLKRTEVYVMGIKSESWKTFNEIGEKVLDIYYKDGREYKIDGAKLK